MIRPTRLLPILFAVAAVAFSVSGCGTQKISIPKSDPDYSADVAAATLFNQRCGGCHTLSYAGTHGSGENPRTYEAINGPNFNERCERPVERVLYAIENGGFSGAYMPQNIVVGKQAREVAMFVSRFAGRQAPVEPGVAKCDSTAIGTLPALPSASGS
jgi:mono/diheme cytochrome c family protein